MAVSVSAEFKALWQKKIGLVQRRRIAIWRRYHDGVNFVNEAAPTYLYEGDFVAWGEIPMQLDSPMQNVSEMAVVTLQLENLRNQWVQSTGTPSFFAADGVSANGYRLFKTIAQLQVGYELSDGTIEWVSVFTGYMLGTKLSTERGIANVTVASKSAFLLEKSQAAKVCTPFTLQNCDPALGDGVNVNFFYPDTGIGSITDVQVAGVSVDPEDFAIGNTNAVEDPESDGRPTITLTDTPGVVPALGATVKASGIKWLDDQDIADLMALVATNAGVDVGDQLLDAIVIPGGAPSRKTIDSAAAWNAGTVLTSIDTFNYLGDISGPWIPFDTFVDGVYSGRTTPGAPEWTAVFSDASISAATAKGAFEIASVAGTNHLRFTAPFTQAVGHILFKFKVDDLIISNTIDGIVVAFQMTQVSGFDAGGYPTIKGYGLFFNANGSGGGTRKVYLCRFDDTYQGSRVILADLGTVDIGQEIEWKIVRSVAGLTEVYKDNVLAGSATDNTYTTCAYFGLIGVMNAGSGGHTSGTIDEIYYSPQVASLVGVFESAIQDIGLVPIAWGTLDRTETLNGGSIAYATASSVDSIAWDAYVDISAGGVIQSALKRYFKVRAILTPVAGSSSSPRCHKLVANFSTSSVLISLAILDGLTGADAFQRYAALIDYQTGDTGEGKRFLRSKIVSGSPVVELTQENGIIEVLEWDPGHDDVKTVGLVRFGNYIKQYDGASAGAVSPTPEEEYGRVVDDIDLTGALLLNDADLATARARLSYERKSVATKKVRMMIFPVPWLEIGDMIAATVFDTPILGHVVANDPLLRVGTAFTLGSPDVVLANGLQMKVLEYKPNYDEDRAELFAEEILA